MIDLKFIASEIVRAMTPAKLTEEQQEYLQYCAPIVLENQLRKAGVIEHEQRKKKEKTYSVRQWDYKTEQEVVKEYTEDEVLENPIHMHIDDFYSAVGSILLDMKKRIKKLEDS